MLRCGRSGTMRKWLSRNHLGLPYRRRRHPLLSNPSWPAETVLAGLRRRPDREPPACGSVRFSDRTSSERDRTRPDFLELEGSEIAHRAIPQLTYCCVGSSPAHLPAAPMQLRNVVQRFSVHYSHSETSHRPARKRGFSTANRKATQSVADEPTRLLHNGYSRGTPQR